MNTKRLQKSTCNCNSKRLNYFYSYYCSTDVHVRWLEIRSRYRLTENLYSHLTTQWHSLKYSMNYNLLQMNLVIVHSGNENDYENKNEKKKTKIWKEMRSNEGGNVSQSIWESVPIDSVFEFFRAFVLLTPDSIALAWSRPKTRNVRESFKVLRMR